MNKKTFALAATSISIAALALTACGGTSSTPSKPDVASVAAETPATGLSVSGAWVKANGTKMTGAFGILKNNTDQDLTVLKASTPAAGMVELHESVRASDGTMKMQQKKDGFVIPARGQLELKPGGNHLMLMDVSKAINPGDELSFELGLEGGKTITFTAPAKAFSGANETYAG